MKYRLFLFMSFFLSHTVMAQSSDITVQCDPETGLCQIPQAKANSQKIIWDNNREIIYVGDPMCSWCWGISPQLNALKRYADSNRIPFSMIMGGLRAGGGETWNDEFKEFLKHHWEEVSNRSGQPFSYDLLEQSDFNYDTEPACRAIVTTRSLAPEKALAFYELTQHYFYVQSNDPKDVDFYQSICDKLDIDFTAFSTAFNSDAMRQETQNDFKRSGQMGVRGFPTVIYRIEDNLHVIARGYSTYPEMKARLLAIEASAK